MTAQPPLLSEIEAFLRDARMSKTTFGLRAMKDGHFVDRLRRGGRVWPETADNARRFMREYGRYVTADPQPAEAAQ